MNRPQILLLSAYDAASHRYWREGLVDMLAPSADVTQFQLPARHFSWRARGNSLSFAFDERLKHQRWDLLIATSMTDLASLKGMAPHLAQVPSVIYFHENQFAYPGSDAQQGLIDRQLTSIYTALAADHLVFNSAFNRSSFTEGAGKLLKAMPDGVPRDVLAGLKTRVIPVAVQAPDDGGIGRAPLLRVAWNHRFEFDKGPALLLEIIKGLAGVNVEFVLLGERFRQVPAELEEAIHLLKERGQLAHDGYIASRDAYFEWLKSCHVVLSTAAQEFQGLAMLEAIQVGCVPMAPDALVYPEYVPAALRYDDAAGAVGLITRIAEGETVTYTGDISAYQSRNVRNAWQALLGEYGITLQ